MEAALTSLAKPVIETLLASKPDPTVEGERAKRQRRQPRLLQKSLDRSETERTLASPEASDGAFEPRTPQTRASASDTSIVRPSTTGTS